MKDDMISRQAALDALGERPVIWSDNDDYTLGERNQYDMDRLAIETVPSASFENHDEIKSYSKDTISRVAAIKAADSVIERDTSGNNDVANAMKAWKEYIKALPSAQLAQDLTNGCTDTISRQAAIQTAERMYKRCDTSSIEDYHDLMVEAITELPSAQTDIPGINVIIDTIKNAISASTGNEAYMVGLRNGMRWCLSALTDKEPEYEDGAKAARSAQSEWIPVTERLPEENVYVLVWCGEVKIARIICGISKEQRAKMQEGAIDDPVSWGWNLSNGYFEVKRSETYKTCDEYCNNKVPYCWDCIYGEMFGQDVKAWMPLPTPYREGGQS